MFDNNPFYAQKQNAFLNKTLFKPLSIVYDLKYIICYD